MKHDSSDIKFLILLIIIFTFFGTVIGAAIISVWLTEILNKFPTLVVGLLAAIFAFLGVVLSQLWQSKNTDKNIQAQAENLLKQLDNQQLSTTKTLEAQSDNLLKQLENQQLSTDKTIQAQTDNLFKQLTSQQQALDKQLINQKNSLNQQLQQEREAINIKLDHEIKMEKDNLYRHKEEEFYMAMLMCRHYGLKQSENSLEYAKCKLQLQRKDAEIKNNYNELKVQKTHLATEFNDYILKYREFYFKVKIFQKKYLFVNIQLYSKFERQAEELFQSLSHLNNNRDEHNDRIYITQESLIHYYNQQPIVIYNAWSDVIEDIIDKNIKSF